MNDSCLGLWARGGDCDAVSCFVELLFCKRYSKGKHSNFADLENIENVRRTMAKKRTSTVTSEDSTSGKVPHLEDDDRTVPGGNPSKSFKKAAYAAKCVKPESNKPRIIKNLKQVCEQIFEYSIF